MGYASFKRSYMILPWMILASMTSCKSVTKTADTDPGVGWTKGEGVAQIYQGDISLGKDRALRAAKRDAIRRKLGALIRSKTITETGVWVKGEVSSQIDGLVKDHEIISDRQSGQLYRIEILADIYEVGLVNAVENLLNDWEKPVIFGIVTEKIRSKQGSPYFNNALQGLEEYFLKKGFILNKTSNFQRYLKLPLNLTTIFKILAQKRSEPDFDLLIFGNSKCIHTGKIKYQEFQSDLFSSQVAASISIFDIHTKRLIASASGREAYAHKSFEIGCQKGFSKKLMPKLSRHLFDQMIKKWKKQYGSGRPLLAEIKAKISYKKLYDLQSVMRNEIRGVVDIIERNYSSRRAVLEIIYEGKTVDFIEELLNKKLPLSLKVVSKSGRKIFLTGK